MEQRTDDGLSPYRIFSRAEWAAKRTDTPMTLNPDEVTRLRSLHDRLDMTEVEEIYLPLSRLLSLYVAATQRLFRAQQNFLGTEDAKVPFIIGVAGSVAVGKSTTARVLQPVRAPVYSHLTYDVTPNLWIEIDRPDILIVEGLNVLEAGAPPKGGKAIPYVSDFFDFSIYLDADEDLLQSWYVDRFLTLRGTAFSDPKSYFHRYATLSDAQAVETATAIWTRINLLNLRENILPTRQRADLILKKVESHLVEEVALRRL